MLIVALLLASSVAMSSAGSSVDAPRGTIVVPDDYPSISEALAHANDGDVIHVRAGTYKDILNVFKQVTIRAVDGPQATFLEPLNYNIVIFYTKAKIDGFTMGKSPAALIADPRSSGSNISNCVFSDTSVQVQGANVSFWRNVMAGDPQYSRQLQWGGADGMISSNRFQGTGDLYITGENATIVKNEFDNAQATVCGGQSAFSFNLMANNSYEALTMNGKGCTVANNTFRDVGRRAAVLQAGPNVVRGNSFLRCRETGVYVTSSAYGGEGNEICWNEFIDCSYAVQIGYQTRTRLHNNTVADGNKDGSRDANIYVGSALNVIENNTLEGCRGNGISVRAESNLVKDNSISQGNSSSGYAIQLFNPYCIAARNAISGNAGGGIIVYGKDCNVTRNDISFSGGNAIRVFTTGCWVTWNNLLFNNLTGSSNAGNLWDYNLYSDYSGPDQNKDGIGDLPYPIPSNGVEDKHPRYLRSSNVGDMNMGLVPFNYIAAPADGAVYFNEAYYEEIGRKVSEYFYEVSYGRLAVSVQILRPEPDKTYYVPYTKAQMHDLSTHNDIVTGMIQMVDDDHDLRAYDYNASGGKGCLVFIAPADVDGFGSYTSASRSANGILATNDSTTVDYIYTYNGRFGGANKTIRGLAHEYGHFLGKALVTTMTKNPRDSVWTLVDEYLMGDLTCYHSLMGKMTNSSVERVHMDAYIKEWLGWLRYENASAGSLVTVTALSSMRYDDAVYRIPYDIATAAGDHEVGFLLLECRSNSAELNDWDTQTPDAMVLRVNNVRELPGVRDNINLLKDMKDGENLTIPWMGLRIEVLEMNDTRANVSLLPFAPAAMAGAVAAAGGAAAGAAAAGTTHEFLDWNGCPDTDLHATDKFGRHVGVNHATGQFETQIPGAICSGDMLNGLEWIYAPLELGPQFWVEADDTEAFLAQNPKYSTLPTAEGFGIMVQSFDAYGRIMSTAMLDRSVRPGGEYAAAYRVMGTGAAAKLVLSDSVRNVTFSRAGLPSWTAWGITVGSQHYGTNESAIVVQLTEGTFQYSADQVSGYSVPQGGTLSIGSSDQGVTVTYTKQPSSAPASSSMLIIVAVAVIAVVLMLAVFLMRGRRR
jgi:hypothetical protein